jgi:hypothetical protein
MQPSAWRELMDVADLRNIGSTKGGDPGGRRRETKLKLVHGD